MFDFSAFTYRFYSQTVPVLSFFNADIVMRRRSICRRRTKSIVVFVFVFVFKPNVESRIRCQLDMHII